MTAQKTIVKRPITVAVQAAIYSMFLVTSVQAAPTGGQVVGGSGSISQSGATTTINQASQNMAINWQSYNVNRNETVNYQQPNASSISLNRILSNDGSTIAGHINANGQVILVNPNGILFTPTAVINVGGIIASGMDIKPDDFMNGNYLFNAINGKNGTVVNTGTINASLGGNVALLGTKVENDGLIAANLGTVTLAAGKQAVLTFDNGGVLGVRVSKAVLQKDIGVDPAVLNKGNIQAAGGRVLLTASTSQDVFSQAVNTGNLQQATHVVVNADGSFTLGAGADTVNTGSIDTSSTTPNQSGGQVVMLGNNVTSSGTIKADAANGHGGNIQLHSTDTTLLTQDSLTSARAGNNGVGGTVNVLGDKVGLFDQSSVDVSGANGGGQVLIGGDLHGANPNIVNASRSFVGHDVNIYADALDQGDGGKVIVWSNMGTSFLGNIFARGGTLDGNGGFVETSSAQSLLFDGTADRSAVNGTSGTLLLDPLDITINNSTNDAANHDDNGLLSITSSNPRVAFSAAATSTVTITKARLLDALNSGDVTLDAYRDIYINGVVDVPGSGNTHTSNGLTLQAGDDVVINDEINLGSGNLTVTSGSSLCGTNCVSGAANGITDTPGHSIEINAPLYTTGSVTLNSADNIALNDTLGGSTNGTNYFPSSVGIYAGNDITSSSSGDIAAHGAVILYSADAGLQTNTTLQPSLTVTGDIGLSGSIKTNGGAFSATAGDSTSNVGTFANLSSINAGSGAISITTYGSNAAGNGQKFSYIKGVSLTANAYNGSIAQDNGGSNFLDISGDATINAYDNSIVLKNLSNNIGGIVSLSTTQNTSASTITSNTLAFVNAASTTKLGAVSAAGPLTVYVTNNLHLTKNISITDVNATSVGTFIFGASTNNTGSTFTLDPGVSLINTDTAPGSFTVTGGTGNDTFTLGHLFNSTLNTGGGADILNAPDPGASNQNIWSIAGNDTGTLTQFTPTGTITFNQFARLVGGATTADQFTVTGDTQGELQIDGGGGTDSLNFASLGFASPIDVTLTTGLPTLSGAPSTTNVNQFSTYRIGTLTNTNTVVASEIQGPDIYANWSIQSSASVNWTGLTTPILFSGFTTLQGGGKGNTYTISTDLPWTITAGAPLTGTQGDTFNLLSNYSGALNGNTGVDTFNINAAGITVPNITGVGNNDTLYAPNGVTNTWVVNGPNTGTLTNTGGRVTFQNIPNLNGGNAGNIFRLSGGTIATINGGGTTGNQLFGPAANTFWTLTGAGAGTVGTTALAADLVGQFTDIQTLTGATGVTNSLQGANVATTKWYISGTDSGTLDDASATTTFQNMQNITGGSGTNAYYFGPNAAAPSPLTTTGSLSGTLDGGSGGNNALYARSGTGVPSNVWTFTDTVSHVASSANTAAPYVNFIHIQHNNAGTTTDTANVSGLSSNSISAASYNGFASLTGASRQALTGSDNRDTTWHIFAQSGNQNTGSVSVAGYPTMRFTGFGALVGSNDTHNTTVTNTFIFDPNGVFNGTLTGGLNATNELDGLVLTANTWAISATQDGTLNTQTAFVNMQTLVGGNAADSFELAAIFNGQIDGGSGANSLKTQTGTDAWTIDGLNQGTVYDTALPANKTAFTGIAYLYGGTVNNTGNQNAFQFTGTGQLQNTSNAAPGMIQVSYGNSSVTLGMTGTAPAGWQLDYIGNTGATNALTVNGVGMTTANLTYTPNAMVADTAVSANSGTYRQLAYTPSAGGTQSVSVNYRNINATDSVTSNQTVNTLTVLGQGNSTLDLQPGAFQVGTTNPVVNYHNVTNLVANASTGDTITINNDLSLGTGTLTLENGPISQGSGTTLTAAGLVIHNAGTPGATTTLNTDVGALTLTGATGPFAITQNTATPLVLNGVDSTQALSLTAQGDITSSAVLTSSAPVTMTSTGGNVSLSANNQFTGSVSLSGTNVALNNDLNLLLGNITATGSLSISGSQTTTQASGSAIVSTNANGDVVTTLGSTGGDIQLNNAGNQFNYLTVTGGNSVSLTSSTSLGLQSLQAHDVSLTSGGGIENVAGNGVTNITANTVTLNAVNGMGTGQVSVTNNEFTISPTNPLTLDTASLSAINNNPNPATHKGAIVLQNNRDVTIHDLRNNGDIYLSNTGTMTLAVKHVTTGNTTQIVGAIDANYGGSNLAPTFYGNVALIGAGSNSVYTLGVGTGPGSEADITAENLYVANVNQFGTTVQPIRLNIRNQFTLLAGVGSVAYPFAPPANVTTTADLTTYSGLNSLSGEQLIDIESLGDVDPAIFTAVRNYDHEDVAILLPPDQRLGDDQECSDTDKKCKKQQRSLD
ncbi:MAG: filamentous hemagglutinin N-terminal domain-containing protein [Gammaproteobacteria bacterium]|nr:filamentous hemagglutinin N-terminal domain-containing protein [Gammaproteobacteria bacterium]